MSFVRVPPLLMIISLWCVIIRGVAVSEKGSGDVFHCCSPAKWTARVRVESSVITNGTILRNETWMTMYYDSVNQRTAWTGVSEDGEPPIYLRIMEDFKNRSWTIVVDKDLCITYNLSGHFVPKCTPHNVYLVLFAVAPQLQPLEGVFANTAYFKRPNVTGHTTVTVGDCAMVEEVTYYRDTSTGHSIVDHIQYFNQTMDVDESVFDIPDNCIHVPPDQADEDSTRRPFNRAPLSSN